MMISYKCNLRFTLLVNPTKRRGAESRDSFQPQAMRLQDEKEKQLSPQIETSMRCYCVTLSEQSRMDPHEMSCIEMPK
jgi:hypothetical protein